MALSSRQKYVSLNQKNMGTEHNYIMLFIVVVEIEESKENYTKMELKLFQTAKQEINYDKVSGLAYSSVQSKLIW